MSENKLQDVQLRELTECSICCEPFVDPKSLPCLHTFCFKCLRGYGANKQAGESLSCPLCRAEFTIPDEGLGKLPNNFLVGQLLEVSKDGPLRSCCDKHEEKELLMYCRKCKLAVCVKCISTQHRGHDCCDLDKSSESFKELLRGSSLKISRSSDIARRELVQLEKDKADILNQIAVGEQHMIKEFDKMIQIINRRREQLAERFCEIRKNRLRKIEIRKSEIEKRLAIIDQFNQVSDTLIASGPPCDVSRSANSVLAKGDDLIRSQNEFNEEILSKVIVTFTAHDKQIMESGPINVIGGITERTVDVSKHFHHFWFKFWNTMTVGLIILLSAALFTGSAKVDECTNITFVKGSAKVDKYTELPVFSARAFLNKSASLLSLPAGGPVTGITVLGNELFLTRGDSSAVVEVYNTYNFTLARTLPIPNSSFPYAIASSDYCNCLYIVGQALADDTGKDTNFLHIYNVSDNTFATSPLPRYAPGLSVTKRNTVLVTSTLLNTQKYSTIPKKILEYKHIESQLLLIRLVEFELAKPWHSIQLSSDRFLVSHGAIKTENRISIIDANGNVIQSYGGREGSGVEQLYTPIHMAVDKYNNVLVADKFNNRIELLSSSLAHLGYLAISGHQLNQPATLYLDEQNHCLYVGNGDGRVFIFNADIV